MSVFSYKKKSAVRKIIGVFICMLMIFGIFSNEAAYVATAADDTGASAEPQKAATGRSVLDFGKNWSFNLGDHIGASARSFDDSSWGIVDLPHDYSITRDFTNSNTEVESGNLPGGIGWYRKKFTVPAEYAAKEISLTFDGVYNNAYVYVNGRLVAENHYGYNSFTVNIDDYITCNGSKWNVIAVKTDAETASSRWYSGAGIYRDVTMTITDALHVSDNGAYVTTPAVAADAASVHAVVTVANDSSSAKSFTAKTYILAPDGTTAATAQSSSSVNAGGTTEIAFDYNVASPSLWSIGTPSLYTMRTEIYSAEGVIADSYETHFGIRTIEWNADTGFYLNGESIKIKGMCLHHDQGALGAVQEYDAIYRQLTIMKDMGCNAVRTSHNTASKVLIDLCDRMGLLVMEEFFDDWTSPKSGNSNDFSKYFSQTITLPDKLEGAGTGMTWAQFVVKSTMLRDRNAPSIIIWSIGNELYQASSSAGYSATAQKLSGWVKDYDTTRPVTEGNDQSRILDIDTYVDVIGANYHPSAWVNLKNNGSFTKPFIATETASAITSRGIYTYAGDRQGGKLGNRDYSLYSYDNSRVNWGSTAAEAWYYTAVNDWYSGEFVWTGFDYIGEPTPWFNAGAGTSLVPNSAYFGVVDTAGFAKDQFYLYRSWWNEKDTTLHLLPGTWNSDNLYVKNGFVYVNVYSNARRIELLLNGNVIGTAESTDVTTANGFTYKTWDEATQNYSLCKVDEIYSGTGHDLYAQFFVKYEEGTLSVKAYDADNREITDTVGTKSVSSGKPAVKIVSKVWEGNKTFTADSDSYAYVEFEAVDADGNPVNDYYGTLNVNVNNDGVIAGVDNGNQGTVKKFRHSTALLSDTSASIDFFGGKALAIIKTTENPNNVQITGTTNDGLTVEGSTFTSVEPTQAEKMRIFENAIVQNPTPYVPTIYDRYETLVSEIGTISSAGSVNEYTLYPVQLQGNNENTVIPDGDYIIYGLSNNPNVVAAVGAATHTVYTGSASGVMCTGVQGTPSATDAAWHFERLSNGKYYVSFTDDNGVRQYMTLGTSAGSLTLSATPYELTVTIQNNGVLIHNGTQYVNYYGSTSPKNLVSTWAEGTVLTLYTVNNSTVSEWEKESSYTVGIEDGEYALVSSGCLVTETVNAQNMVDAAAAEINGTVLNNPDDCYYVFERVGSGETFTIKNSSGKYMNIGNSNGTLSFTDTPQALNVYVANNGSIAIYNDAGQFLDLYVANNAFSTWTGTTSNVTNNRKFNLYKRPDSAGSVDAGTSALYQALQTVSKYKPGVYNADAYTAYIEAMEAGVDTYNDANATSEQKAAAAQNILNAINSFSSTIKKFPARIIKYGYNPSSSTPYVGGSIEFNEQTYTKMEQAIRANDNVLSQIKTVIDYDGTNGTAWEEGYADTALDAAIAAYAKIYSLSFRDFTVTGTVQAENFYQTAWNHWQKNNTQGANENKDEGVSLQGIYSRNLGSNGMPVSHTVYDLENGLNYLSGHSISGLTSNINITVSTGASATTSVTLTPLNNISVYVPDFFSPNNVEGVTNEYTKYYWNTEFPFFVTTDSDGVNHYVYDSSDDGHMLRASYDDAAQSATVDFVNETSWSVNRPYVGAGKGFFPFNYQIKETGDTTVFAGESAVYHFGMTFSMDFYIPKGGKISKTGEDYEFFFSGDDDVLVYVDDVLVLDNGGLHGARTCSINFTEASVSYQYAMNVADGELISTVENGVMYKYGETYDKISDVNQTAIDYLNQIRNDGKRHTFSFFYLERGSTESNCKITFNLQQISEHVKLNDQTLVADYGLPINYNVTENNIVTETAAANGAVVNYIGITDETDKAISFSMPENLIPIEKVRPLERTGNYGSYSVTSTGAVTYSPFTMEFAGSDSFYICAEVINDPTYSNGTVYYAFESVTFVPATNVYFEENFVENEPGGVSYFDGSAAAGFDNSTAKHGQWSTVTNGTKAVNQAADLAGSSKANVYGFDPSYDNKNAFSDSTARKVTVSTKNNPNSYYSGGTGASWPKLRFSFTGTGFDLMSVTDSTTGVFVVDVYSGTDVTSAPVRKHIVDTYYGYSYVRLYADANGELTGTVTDTPLYWTKNNNATVTPTYYGEDGVITLEKHYYDVSGTGYTYTPTYYASDGSLTTSVTGSPAYSYAYAYGWLKDENSDTDSLYQIPVISVEDLNYGQYTVVITAMFSTFYGHYNEDMINGESVKSYDLYVDGIRIFNPAGIDNGITDKATIDAYKKDGEAYPNYIELRNMLIGADSFGTNPREHGIIFIDGIPALDNDIEKYRVAGPNNELYLCSGQAVAFEIWASAVPSDLQIFAKSAKGTPTMRLTYDGLNVEKSLPSASQMALSFNSVLPVSHKLEWTQVTVGGKAYYTTGTVVIANSSAQDSILSLGELKWTFDDHGAYGFFRIPDQTQSEELMLMSTPTTYKTACAVVSTLNTETSVKSRNVAVSTEKVSLGNDFDVSVETSDDVKELLVRDDSGALVTPAKVAAETSDGRTVWSITLHPESLGEKTYSLSGVNEYGIENSNSADVTVMVEDKTDDKEHLSFFEKLVAFFARIINFLKSLFR